MLVACPECGAQISEKADPCPQCGLPLAGFNSKEYWDNVVRRMINRTYLLPSHLSANNGNNYCVDYADVVEIIEKEGRGLTEIVKCRGCGKKFKRNYFHLNTDGYFATISDYVEITDYYSSCFVATVVYQNNNAYEVCLLRQFRDQILTKHLSGRIFIALYYAWLGKTLAKIVNLFGAPGRLICKLFMDPLIWWISRPARRTISQINRR